MAEQENYIIRLCAPNGELLGEFDRSQMEGVSLPEIADMISKLAYDHHIATNDISGTLLPCYDMTMTSALTEISETPTRHEVIATLAYGLWEKRGRPLGDSEADWFSAENTMPPVDLPPGRMALQQEVSPESSVVPVKKQAELTEWQQEVKAAEDKIGAFAHSVKKPLHIEK